MKANSPVLKVAIAALGLTALLAGCGTNTSGTGSSSSTTGSNQDDPAKQQFLIERSGNVTPGVITDTMSFGQARGAFGGPGGGEPPVFGEVESASDTSLVVNNPMEGNKTTVNITKDTQITRQASVQLSDIKQGDKIFALGQEAGDAVAANIIMIGVESQGDSAAPMGGGPIMFGRGPGSGAGPGQGGAMGNPNEPQQIPLNGTPKSVNGTVDKIDSNTISVKAEDGSTTVVQISDDTRLQRTEKAQASDIKAGDTVSAQGTREGDALEAKRITIMPAMNINR